MDDKYKLAAIGVVSLVGYGVAAMHYGYNGTVTTTVIAAIVGLITGTIGFAIGKFK